MSKNNFDYIREAYQVPAKKGVKVIANGKQGTIIGTHNASLKIKLDNGKIGFYHPVWNMEYLN